MIFFKYKKQLKNYKNHFKISFKDDTKIKNNGQHFICLNKNHLNGP